MSSVLRSVRKRKKGRTLGAVDVIDREGYAELEVDAKVELIRSLIPLGLMHIEELLDEEVTALAGERYARKAPSVGGRRHGSNPGTVGLAGQRVPIRVPRIRHVTEREIPLRSYEALHGDRAVNDLLLRRVLYGISCRNYAAAAEAIPGAIGLSGSTVSRAFIQASATKLRELQERDLSGEDVVALVLDGKTFAEATMVVALGITMTGDKRFLGFVETDTENEQVLTPFLRSLVERGLDVSQGLLVIVDGGKGLRAAVRHAFRHRALVQRCQWHTRENVVSDVAKREQPVWRQRLQRADNRPEYDEALAALQSLQHELEDRNQSAAGSLPWCTTRDLGQYLPSTPRSEVPHDELQAHPAEVRPEGLPCPELAGVRDGSPRSRESDRRARTHRWQARQLELAEADAQEARPTTPVLEPRHRDDGHLGLGVWPGVQAD